MCHVNDPWHKIALWLTEFVMRLALENLKIFFLRGGMNCTEGRSYSFSRNLRRFLHIGGESQATTFHLAHGITPKGSRRNRGGEAEQG
jgi:hypothetical protein